ncbi:hypothetical protein [Nonlabens agnitus]|uniref:YD repeat-containing protein n=1 Tax=Nonlabens agnitus TaxID=870484 RepID=A0A2S9WUM3_9FLAO|nr:hypothetical protein [Nonlabens agnitus]PRP67173.1 hypothetical protein BST86_08710 [Nonlabens agnitus]
MKYKKAFFIIFFIAIQLATPLWAQESEWRKCHNYLPFYYVNDGVTQEYEMVPRTAQELGLKGNIRALEYDYKKGYSLKSQENEYLYANAITFERNGYIRSKLRLRKKPKQRPQTIKKVNYGYGNEAIVNGKILYIENSVLDESTTNSFKEEDPRITFDYDYITEDGKITFDTTSLMQVMIYIGDNFKIQRVYNNKGKLFKERRYSKVSNKIKSNGLATAVKNTPFYLSRITSFSYDDEMRLVKTFMTKKRPDGSSEGFNEVTYSYKEIGDKLQVTKEYEENNRVYEELKIFNSAKLLTEVTEKVSYPSGRTTSQTYQYQYEYDAQGNWTERRAYQLVPNQANKLIQTTNREIIYRD